MHPAQLVLLAAAIVLFILLRRASLISAAAARKYLQNGALVIDVRTEGEFRAQHLPNALHYPVDSIGSALPQRVKDKQQVLLLHCQSGMRSGIAKKQLRGLGYTHAYNLGSYARAARILNGR